MKELFNEKAFNIKIWQTHMAACDKQELSLWRNLICYNVFIQVYIRIKF